MQSVGQNIVHTCKLTHGNLSVGDEIHMYIDQVRMSIIKQYTAAVILLNCLSKKRSLVVNWVYMRPHYHMNFRNKHLVWLGQITQACNKATNND